MRRDLSGHRRLRRCPDFLPGGAVALLLLLLCVALSPQAVAKTLQAESFGRAVEIVDGDTLVLDDRREIRLVGIQAPKLPLGRKGFKTWPLARDAKAALVDLALDRRLGLAFGGSRRDRHGRVLAHLYRDDGLWVQGRMLESGMARVYSFSDNRALVAEMLALEARARDARRGIWAVPYYAIRSADAGALEKDIGSFQLIEGRVYDVARVRGRVFLNFERDWRRDFTISLRSKVARRFRAEGLDPLDLEGRLVRVRGWLKEENGPMIEASHLEQIELLD